MDLRKLNSITKYPSILTYHEMGERGRLNETLSEGKLFEDNIYVYEKVDGENSRIILLNTGYEADYLIGSREELLYAKGDRIGNPYGNIAEFLKPIADELADDFFNNRNLALTVVYQESYGGKTKASKNYTSSNAQGYRVFDMFSLTHEELNKLMGMDIREIASWRDHGGQPFYSEINKEEFILKWGLDSAPLLDIIDGLPTSIETTYEVLKQFPTTHVGIDAMGKSEGIIVRNQDRSLIRKIRFEDYERTLKVPKK
jgi:hypothetical protein